MAYVSEEDVARLQRAAKAMGAEIDRLRAENATLRSAPRPSIAAEHAALVHPDGSECRDGCNSGPVHWCLACDGACRRSALTEGK